MSEKVCTTIIIAEVVGYDGKSTTSYHMPVTSRSNYSVAISLHGELLVLNKPKLRCMHDNCINLIDDESTNLLSLMAAVRVHCGLLLSSFTVIALLPLQTCFAYRLKSDVPSNA